MSRSDIILLIGCFWGGEHALRTLGVETEVGYAGGLSETSPTYYNLDRSGHSEAVRVSFDPDATSVEAILSLAVEKSEGDPSSGSHPRYRRAVLCRDEEQADRARRFVAGTGCDFDVSVSTLFHRAEPYHQGYYARVLAD